MKAIKITINVLMYLIIFLIYWIISYLYLSINLLHLFKELIEMGITNYVLLMMVIGSVISIVICIFLNWIRRKNIKIFYIMFLIHIVLLVYLINLFTSDLGGPVRLINH